MMTKIRDLMARREAGEKGFTLIELLVVIIIIGILAAVAIPIFMNQQKSAVDSATTSDVRNVATNIETLRVKEPNATFFAVTDEESDTPADGGTVTDITDGDAWLWVGTSETNSIKTEISVSDNTSLTVASVSGSPGQFTVEGYNSNGNNNSSDPVVWKSAEGGLTN